MLGGKMVGDTSVAAIGLGLMTLSGTYGPVASDEERLKFLDEAYARGERNWDTADRYAGNEELLGKWFKRSGKRADIFLATKFGLAHGDSKRVVRADPEYVREAFNKSLERLGVDTVDLYYLHRADPSVPIELTVRAMAELVTEGKVKYLGLSEVSAATLRRAHAVHPIAAIQLEYSPFELGIEDPKIGILAAARELGVTVFAYSPLGRGILTGQYKSVDDFAPTDLRRMLPRFSKENFPNILKLVDGIQSIAKKYSATPGQVALAWLLAQGEDIIPIPGTTKIANLDENLAALNLKLTPEEVQEIREIAIKSEVAVIERYPEVWRSYAYADTPELKE
ncbi:Aldo/keto reductase [Punctularia strigosozonata HHB-11173 SS5]|uniref:Aldo/keto reductase n=1 Tax=Punctularia strigosozonata (strain HHB-11173) TaxID=741275 RepID=UPI0004416A23|nr:Aldo/keto reductase [Punctularia strigosozonata HHB-11173 SS5]EIN08934.1 Aldo/keto reductase [Punctularia strigosozonata HHB-11173 SS5]